MRRTVSRNEERERRLCSFSYCDLVGLVKVSGRRSVSKRGAREVLGARCCEAEEEQERCCNEEQEG